MPRFSSSRFRVFGPSKCLVPTPGLTSSTLRAVCVCVCVYKHTHTHTLPPAPKNREDTYNTPEGVGRNLVSRGCGTEAPRLVFRQILSISGLSRPNL